MNPPRTLLAGLAAVLAAAAALLPACNDNAYCFSCEQAGAGGADGDASTNDATGGKSGAGGIFIEAGEGSNCSSDLMTDPQNCGSCGHKCDIPNAFPKCQGGFCLIDKCAAGYFDVDGKADNGCEYECLPVLDGNGDPVTEEVACDGKDDDCDGAKDEIYDVQSNPQHCGLCNNVCSIPGAKTKCVAGECEFDGCLDGYADENNDLYDGCECNSLGLELCNNQDDDCDGTVDEGFDLGTDANNCGACNNVCGQLFPNASTSCQGGACEFGGCLPGYYNYDGELLNGCEYACTPGTPATEVCDGVDNDCDGLKDNEPLPGVGDACGSGVGECKQGTNQCVNGVLACQNAVGPQTEVCDNKDNDCNNSTDEGCPTVGATDVRLDTGSTVNQYPSSQLHVAAAGTYVFAAFLDRRGNSDIRFVSTSNGGASWSADVAAASNGADEVEPWVFGSSTRAYVAHERFEGSVRRIYLTSAASPFTTFVAPVRADKITAGAADAFFLRGVLAATGAQDSIVLVWQLLNGTSRDIYLQASADGGATWLAQDVRVNTVAGKADTPSIATDGQGRVFIAWRDNRASKAEVYADVYTMGAGLAGNQALSAGNASKPPVVAADGAGNVHVAWTDLRGAKKAIRVNSSTNSGASFKPDGVLVNVDSTFADADAPALVARASRVVVAWEDTRSGLPDVRVNRSLNGGATWQSTCARADGGTAGTYASKRPMLAFGAGDVVFVTWEENRVPGQQRDIYANHSTNLGTSFQPKDLRLDVGGSAPASAPSPAGAADSSSPFIFAPGAGDRAAVVWLDGRTGAGANGDNADVYGNALVMP